jgi:hypothetical protein
MEKKTEKLVAITLNENEKNVLLELLDTALKTIGIKGAEATLHFTKKIASAHVLNTEEDVVVAEDIKEDVPKEAKKK